MNFSRQTALFNADLPLSPLDLSLSGDELLNHLATTIATPSSFANEIVCHFEDLLPELSVRWDRILASDPVALTSIYGRYLTLVPSLAEHAAAVLRDLSHGNLLSLASASPEKLQSLLLSLLRLLRADNASFAPLFRPASLSVFLYHDSVAVRYLAVRLMCLYLHVSDATAEELITKYCGGQQPVGQYEDHDIDYTFLDLWEQKRLGMLSSRLRNVRAALAEAPATVEIASAQEISQLSNGVASIAGTLMFTEMKHTNGRPKHDVVMTPSTAANLGRLASALKDSDAVLISGSAGCGKTLSVNHLASTIGKGASMITLHLNEQSDAKALLGIYTTGDQPGSFVWKPGVLTTAARQGRWVFIEDLDRCPNEVLSILNPLLERRELRIPGQDACQLAHPGFKLIASLRLQRDSQGRVRNCLNNMLGIHKWDQVLFDDLDDNQLHRIVLQKFPQLTKLLNNILNVYRSFKDTHASKRNRERDRAVTPRDLLKWCQRIASALEAADYQPGSSTLSQNLLNGIFLNAVDCFVGWRTGDDERRAELITNIAAQLHVPPNERDFLCEQRTPFVKNEKKYIDLDRVRLTCRRGTGIKRSSARSHDVYSFNRHSSRVMEQIGCAMKEREPLLLVGETGIGKTTAVQQLASMLQQPLMAINLSQQSEVSDLIGGYKPVAIHTFAIPLKDEFDRLFDGMFSAEKNAHFNELLHKAVAKSQWKHVVKFWKKAIQMVHQTYGLWSEGQAADIKPSKRRKLNVEEWDEQRRRWHSFSQRVADLEKRLQSSSGAFAFAFVEGKLVNAVREGGWVLLDEINLASPDTLECLSDLLEEGPNARPSLLLTETGSTGRVEAHPDFRIIAAMNPSTDIGKRDLPPGIRSRFTEIYVNSLDRDQSDLENLIQTYICGVDFTRASPADRAVCSRLSGLYSNIQQMVTEGQLLDGSGQRPQYSLRTLTRALQHANSIRADVASLKRAIYEGFVMTFSTCLGAESYALLDAKLQEHIYQDTSFASHDLRKSITPSKARQAGRLSFQIRIRSAESKKAREETHWLPRGKDKIQVSDQYIITPYIAQNLRNLIRAASSRKYPVLIQGPTSAGKTSMIEYLAQRSGNRFVRINNHEHTDLQEYVGTYMSSPDGKIVFQEGVLVEALRKGYWVVLDELNLAPTDILEALNRLLDDNRELLIPETQEVVKPHPDFMLFATQNPVGAYGGRKILSRAFRNRFLELHFDDIPVAELNVILAARSSLPESWCGQIIQVYEKLSQRRQESRLFDQNSFATLRDLFRWAFRGGDSIEQLALNGFMLLGDKVRKPEERDFVRSVIEKNMSRPGVKLNLSDDKIYNNMEQLQEASRSSQSIVWTRPMRRLGSLISAAVVHKEPVLLVGETGGGKTTICQLIAEAHGKELSILNAHQNMETGDLVGAQRPLRNKAGLEQALIEAISHAFAELNISADPFLGASSALSAYDSLSDERKADMREETRQAVESLRARGQALFEWRDGSLVQSMREGNFFLLDEISLADDSVLERMNSVLDPQRSILLAEKGAQADALVTAADGFQMLATMNPGGDFGKKELSPALRNRFTEIWVPSLDDVQDVQQIVTAKLCPEFQMFCSGIVDFASWFSQRYYATKATSVSIRDLLAWVKFINDDQGVLTLKPFERVVHGALMVYVDTLGANPSGVLSLAGLDLSSERSICLARLSTSLGNDVPVLDTPTFTSSPDALHIGPFALPCIGGFSEDDNFQFGSSTTRLNLMRLVRGLQMDKPVLMEGAPGVGKTSLVTSLAKCTGHPLTRINLSDQTDLMDLFGSDVPVEDAAPGTFTWRDAPFLTAMKSGQWVLLDEMNLAAQPVLEGLNACIDHRGEVFIPELDKTFQKHPDFRLFAAQNPQGQGGGRKGLPSSFVNRFTVVFADAFQTEDLRMISSSAFPGRDTDVEKLVAFLAKLNTLVEERRGFADKGSPWEFNLRDTLRVLSLTADPTGEHMELIAGAGLPVLMDTVFTQRFRTGSDRKVVADLIAETFDRPAFPPSHYFNLTPTTVQVGFGVLPRQARPSGFGGTSVRICKSNLGLYQSLAIGIQNNWPIVLVGSAEVERTRHVQNLAAMTGAFVDVLSINTDIDASDLIGAFEQVDPARKVEHLIKDIMTSLSVHIEQSLRSADNKAGRLSGLLSVLDACIMSSLEKGIIELRALRDDTLDIEDESLAEKLSGFLKLSEKTLAEASIPNAARFTWIDSVLVKAIEKGHWIVLENANLCNASVLDRLNSLLEVNGSLTINEHCEEDGSPKLLKPHPDFRIFLTVDPQYGEISRAMRNRALELFVTATDVSNDEIEIPLSSSLVRYAQLSSADTACNESASLAQCEQVATIAFQHLSLSDFALFTAFRNETGKGLVSETLATALADVAALYDEATREGSIWLHQDEQAVSSVLHVRGPMTPQPVHSMTNVPLALALQNLKHLQAPIYQGLMHDIRIYISRLRMAFNATPELKTKASTKIWKALRASVRVIEQYALNIESHPVPDGQRHQFEDINVTNTFLLLLKILADQTLSHVGDHTFTSAQIQATRRKIHGLAIDRKALQHLRQQVDNSLKALTPSNEATTGLSFETVWRQFGQNTTTASNSELFSSLRDVAESFDQLAFTHKLPLNDTVQLRVSLKMLIDGLPTGNQDFKDLLSNVQSGIQSMSGSMTDTGLPGLVPHFQETFKTAAQTSIWTEKLVAEASSTNSLALLGHQGLARTIRNTSSGILHNYFGSFVEHFYVDSHSSLAGVQHLPYIAMQEAQSLDQVRLDSVDLLKEEIKSLGHFVARFGGHSVREMCASIDTIVQQATRQVLLPHVELLDRETQNDIVQQDVAVKLAASMEAALSLEPNTNTDRVRDSFKTILSKSVAKGLSRLRIGSETCSWQDIGDGLVSVASGCLRLYVSDHLYDPALERKADRAVHALALNELQHRQSAIKEVAWATLGDSETMRSQLVQYDIQSLGPAPAQTCIERPTVSRLDDLQADFNAIIRAVDRIDSDNSDIQSFQLRSDDIASLITRLDEKLPLHDDLIAPATGFLLCLRYGLIIKQKSQDACNAIKQPSQKLPLLSGGLSEWHDHHGMQGRLSTEAPSHNILNSFVVRSYIQRPSDWPNSAQQIFKRLIHESFRAWKEKLADDQKRSAAASNLYHFKGGAEDMDAEEQEAFEALFPSYDDVSIDVNEAADDPVETSKTFVSRLQANAEEIAQAHIAILSRQQQESTDGSLVRLIEISDSLQPFHTPLRSSSKDLEPAKIQRLIAEQLIHINPLLLALHRKQQQLNRTEPDPKVNIYTDSLVSEALRLHALTLKTNERATEILKAWPEHSTLHNIRNVCSDILAFQHTEPLIKLLTKTEQLHTFIAEWQTVASREYSMAKQNEDLTQLLVSWRRLELSTWSRLLDDELSKSNRKGLAWFFIAYENLVALPQAIDLNDKDLDSHISGTIQTLESLLRNSPIGEYRARMDIIKSLAKQLKLSNEAKPMLSRLALAISNFLAYFRRYDQGVQDKIESVRKELEKQVRDVIQLASWRDVNINSLRQSAKASHRKLFNIIRKFREALGKPVFDLLGHLSVDIVTESYQTIRKLPLVVDPSADAYCRTGPAWTQRPIRFQNVDATTNAMSKMLPVDSFENRDLIEQIEDFIAGTETSVKQLRDATPGILTEANTSLVKHLQSNKRRLYADVLKSLKHMGLRFTQTTAVLAQQKSLSVVLSGKHLVLSPDSSSKAHAYFFSALEAMEVARTKINDHSEDMTPNDISRSIGFCEAMLAMCLTQRQLLAESQTFARSMTAVIDRFGSVWSHQASSIRVDAEVITQASRYQIILTWLPSILKTALRIIEAQSSVGAIDLSMVSSAIQAYIGIFAQIQEQLEAVPLVAEGLVHESMTPILQRTAEEISSLEGSIDSLTTQYPHCEATLAQVLLWTRFGSSISDHATNLSPNGGVAAQGHITLQTFNERLFSALDSLLIGIQDAKLAQEASPEDAETEGWLVKETQVRQEVLCNFRMESVVQSLSSVADAIANVDQGHGQLEAACASVCLALPIMRQYVNMYQGVLQNFMQLHGVVTEMLYKLTSTFNLVATHGFCRPPDKSDEKQSGTDKIESGTGLGEGEGAEDISKDIAEDEDLDDIAQDAENTGDGEKEGPENEDNAVDIKDEMAGGKGGESKEDGEAEGEDKNEDDQEGDDEDMGDGAGDDQDGAQEEGKENEGMDEGVGKVDEAEPSAVDEKFWDQAGEEKQREKEGQQPASNKDQDNAAAGKDKDRSADDQDENADPDDSAANDGSDEDEYHSAAEEEGQQQQNDVMDPHVHETEELDLPEDLNLDGDKDGGADKDDDDLDMDALSQTDDGAPEQEPGTPEPDENIHDGEQGDTAEGEDHDMADAPEHDETNDQEAKDTSKPYAAEEQDNQDTDPSGTAQGTDGEEMISGAARDVQEAPQPEDGEESNEQNPEAAPNDDQSKPAGAGEPGHSSSAKPSQENTQPETPQQQTLKRLGDMFEKWHRQRRQINENVSQRDEGQAEQQDVDVKDADFEHLPDEDAKADTQALGAADQEQARALDDSMAIPDEGHDDSGMRDDQFLPDADDDLEADANEDTNLDDSADQAAQNEDNEDSTRPKSMVGGASTGEPKQPHEDDVMNDDESLDEAMSSTGPVEDDKTRLDVETTNASATWAHHISTTASLSLILTEQLRLILTPTQATKLRGDFRTGKRLNLKRIVPYIASSYRRDKIWLRRAAPSKRTYQIVLAIDDSRSMAAHGASDLALSCLALVSSALTALESGELGVLGFGTSVFEAHPLGTPFSSAAGPAALGHFHFAQDSTDVKKLVSRSLDIFRAARARAPSDAWQLQIILSDGICQDHAAIARLLLDARDERLMFVFVIVDATAKGTSASHSILELNRAEFTTSTAADGTPTTTLVHRRYLDTFPFKYFLVVRDVQDLPDVLAGALRSWFAEVAEL